ncbi:hypothetical protein J6590_062869 [Homalodisca vitripennis]|nr:hypothetical protein J6590_062869 [Homalodisca vitripennis]
MPNRASKASMKVVVFMRNPHLYYTSHVSLQFQTRVKLNRDNFPRRGLEFALNQEIHVNVEEPFAETTVELYKLVFEVQSDSQNIQNI